MHRNINKPECQSICNSKSLGYYEFPVNFYQILKKNVENIFYIFSGETELEDYYAKII